MNAVKRHIYAKKRARAEEDDKPVGKTGLRSDADAKKPHVAWKKIRPKCDNVTPVQPNSPIKENAIRFVCIGDSHNRPERKGLNLDELVPPGDVMLHVGDFTMYGRDEELTLFNSTFGTLPHKVKLLIAGNHDMTLDPWVTSPEEAASSRALLSNFIYLQDALIEICGIRIYGSPWVPRCGSWGFSAHRGEPLLRIWSLIPDDTDILMTHGPPVGYGDMVFDGHRVGCVDLLHTIQQRVKPKYHICGHIHEGYGSRTDGQTVFINAAMCTSRYKPVQQPIVFDYPLPSGHSKEELDLVNSSMIRLGKDLLAELAVSEKRYSRKEENDRHTTYCQNGDDCGEEEAKGANASETSNR